jgi:hypothetical protein
VSPADEGFQIREAVRGVLIRLLREHGGGVADRTLYGTTGMSDATVQEPGPPLEAIRLAKRLGWAVQQALETQVKYARQDGATWKEIGEAMGYTPDPDTPPLAESAFRVVAPGTSEYNRYFTWTCPSCRAVVADYGPYEANPAETERRHGDGCGRLAAAVAGYERQWRDDR